MSNPSEKLLIAAANGNLENVIQELKNNANINATDLNGYAPIHCAVYNNKVEVVRHLVKSGANVLMKDTHAYVGFTPLHYASAFGSSDMVKALLLSTEKDLHCKNSTGQTPADVSSNSEVKALLLQDQQLRNVLSEEKFEKLDIKEEQVENNENENHCSTSKCCRGKKIGKKILFGIISLIFFGGPALQLFFNAGGSPVYIIPNAIIIWAIGFAKILCKSKTCEKMKEKKGLLIHGWTVLVFNVFVIILNLLSTNAPWWILVALITGAPVAIHKIKKSECCGGNMEKKGLAVHGVLYGSFVVGSYVMYCLVYMMPWQKSFVTFLIWFLLPAVWTVVFVAHVYLVKKNRLPFKIRIEKNDDVENQNQKSNENVSLNNNNVVEQVKSEQSSIYPQVL